MDIYIYIHVEIGIKSPNKKLFFLCSFSFNGAHHTSTYQKTIPSQPNPAVLHYSSWKRMFLSWNPRPRQLH